MAAGGRQCRPVGVGGVPPGGGGIVWADVDAAGPVPETPTPVSRGWPDGDVEQQWHDAGQVPWTAVLTALATLGVDITGGDRGLMSVTIADGKIVVVRARRSLPSGRFLIGRDEPAFVTKEIMISDDDER